MTNNFHTPNYDKGIFRVMPTILTESFKLELEEPHENFVFKTRKMRQRFTESEIVLLVIYDALAPSLLKGKMLDFWKENCGETLSSIVPTLTGPAVLSINSGLPPDLSGVMNTKIYIPEIGNYVNILKGYASGSKITLEEAGVRIRSLLWEKPVTDYIPEDILLFDFLPNEISDSKGLRAFYAYRSQSIPYNNEVDAVYILRSLLQHLENRNSRALITLYFSGIDTIAHNHGIEPDVWSDILDLYHWTTTKIIEATKNVSRPISIYFISDHGLDATKKWIELEKETLEENLGEIGVEKFAKSGRFAMIYGENIDIEALEDLLQNSIKIVETEKILDKYWPLANKNKFLSRAGKYTALFPPGTDILIKKTTENTQDQILQELKKLKANHGAPTKHELEAFFACHTKPT